MQKSKSTRKPSGRRFATEAPPEFTEEPFLEDYPEEESPEASPEEEPSLPRERPRVSKDESMKRGIFQPSKTGILKPKEKSEPIQIIGDILQPEIEKEVYTPKKVKVLKLPQPPKGYRGKLKYGKKVEFQYQGKTQIGIIKNFTEHDVVIESNQKVYKIDYSKIDTIKPVSTKVELEKSLQRISDFYTKNVPEMKGIRKMVVNYIFDILSQLDTELVTSKPQEQILVPEYGEIKIKPWEEYLEEEFKKWYITNLRLKIIKEANEDEEVTAFVNKIAHEIFESLSDTHDVLKFYNERHHIEGQPEFFHLDGSEMLKRIENTRYLISLDPSKLSEEDRKRLTELYIPEFELLDVEIESRLMKLNLLKLPRSRLIFEITEAVKKFQKNLPPELQIQKNVFESYISESVNTNYDPKEEDRKEFKKQYLKDLKKLYQEYVDVKEREKKEYEKLIEEKQELKEFQDYMRKNNRYDLTEKGYQYHKQVVEFEESIYKKTKIIYEYLSFALYPGIFMNKYNDIGRYCKFFQSKIKTGEFPIRSLKNANLAHYFPELMMKHINKEGKFIGEEQKDLAKREINKALENEINQLLNQYIIAKRMDYPFVKLETPQKINFWRGFVSKPQEICNQDTGTGYKSGRRIAKGRYSKEPMPDVDLVICHTKGLGFSCHNTKNIIEDIVFEGGINPITGEPYPKNFVQKMRKRYPEAFENAEKRFEQLSKEEKKEGKIIQKYKEKPLPEDIWKRYEILFGKEFVREEKARQTERERQEAEFEKLAEEIEGEFEGEEEEEIEEEINLEKTVEEKKNVVAFFYADWDEDSMKILEKNWNNLQEKFGNFAFVKIDFDKNEDLAEDYGVESIPTFILFKNRKKVLKTRRIKRIQEKLK